MNLSNKTAAQAIRFRLSISADKYLAFYQGAASDILVNSLDNRSLRFPAGAIRNFLGHEGIYGLFEIQFDANNKLIQVVKIS